MTNSATNRLKEFQAEHNAYTKGPLSLLVQLTRIVRTKTLPAKKINRSVDLEGKDSEFVLLKSCKDSDHPRKQE